MRNLITLAAAAIMIVACADDPHPTSPATSSGTRSANGNVQSADKAPVVQAKPVDQIGFTKITTVVSISAYVPPGQLVPFTATCPDGTTAISGGHFINGVAIGAPAAILQQSRLNDTNGWTVAFNNNVPGAGNMSFVVFVHCAS